jgi:hypothetical protein
MLKSAAIHWAGVNMDFDREDVTDLASALERQIESQGEAAKRAIREYKKAIRRDSALQRVSQNEARCEVLHAVDQYMQLRRRLDDLRMQMSQLPPRAG